MRMKLFNDQRGDTIMEVLICVAMLGFMLGTAFSLTNKNQLTNRATQERSEATKLAERQTENLRSHYAKYSKYEGNALIGKLSEVFCYNPNTTGEAQDLYVAYNNSCKYSPNGSGGVEYDIKIHRADTTAAANLGSKGAAHVVTVTWDDVRGGAGQELKVFYSLDEVSSGLYSDSVAIPPPPPPPPPVPAWTVKGSSYISCTGMHEGNPFNGCFTSGDSMYSWVDFSKATYNISSTTAVIKLKIKYRQHINSPPGGSGNVAAPGYSFLVRVRNNELVLGDYYLPAGAPGEEKIATIDISGATFEQLKLSWLNNNGYVGSEYNPNLQIDSVEGYQ